MTPRLQTKYQEEITGTLRGEFGYSNTHQVPQISKIVLNMGLGAAVQNPKIIEDAQKELTKADKSQRAARNRLICIVIAVLVALIVLILFLLQ